MSDYKKMMGYNDKKVSKKKSKPKVNEVINSIKKEFDNLNESVTWDNRKFGERLPTMEDYQEAHDKKNMQEGPAYEYKKHHTKISKSLKDLQKNYLNFYDSLRKKGMHDEAADFLDNYKKNVVDFTKKYNKDFGKLL